MPDEKLTDEYYDLINKSPNSYSLTIVGRTLDQDEVDKIVEVLNNDVDEYGWCEEHLIEALKQFKANL